MAEKIRPATEETEQEEPKKKSTVQAKEEREYDLNALDADGQPVNARCTRCMKVKPKAQFYKMFSANNQTGHSAMCKECIQELSLDGNGKFTPQTLYNICRILDRPYYYDKYVKANEKVVPERLKVGEYLNSIGKKASGGATFADGERIEEEDKAEKSKKIFEDHLSDEQLRECEDLFGYGLSPEQYARAWYLFSDLRNNYPLKTNMHKQKLAEWAVYKMMAEEAIANKDASEAAKWGKLAKDTATDAKINPSQLSAADLSEGMTCFSQLSAAVEKAVDVIPLFPEFKEQPKDRVDYTLWEYVNCARHMMGLPLITYAELYGFLERRRVELQGRYSFLKKEEDGHFDEKDIDKEDS